MTNSILDDLGQEVTGIVAPVSICMFLTVLLVRILNPEGVSNPSAVAIAQTFYKEQVKSVALPLAKIMDFSVLHRTMHSICLP